MSTTVLVVEDQWNLRKLSVLALQTSGYKVIEAESGVQALEKLSKFKIDLILTEWCVPVSSDGGSLVRKLKARKKHAGIPIVVLSRDKCPGEASTELKQLGVRSWLRKPCRISTLRKAVSDIVDLECQPDFSRV